jgi:membrane protease YdiL (CAAX protease family)
MMSRKGFLRLEWGVSIALVVLALGWAALRELELHTQWRATPGTIAAGIAVGAALWLAIPLLFWVSDTRRVLDGVLVPFSRTLAPRDMVVIAALSGVSEELFFRGVLLAEIGLVASSVIFGLLHALTWAYAAWAAVIGAGFGLLALEGESLVTPVVAHATYNFGALVLLRRWPSGAPASVKGSHA